MEWLNILYVLPNFVQNLFEMLKILVWQLKMYEGINGLFF
jgi:hypothetical protein